MILALSVPRPERATARFHPYVSEFQYAPRYHPSRNPYCTSQWPGREPRAGQFGHEAHRRSMRHEEPVAERDRPWIEIRAVLVRCSKAREAV